MSTASNPAPRIVDPVDSPAERAHTSATDTPGLTRRSAVRAVGGGAVASALLGGCATTTEQATQAASSVASQAASAASSAGGAASSAVASAAGDLVKAAEIPVGGGKVLSLLKVVITQPSAGDYKAFSAICTHEGCPVTDVEGGAIICPCHNSKFDITTGAVLSGPAKKPLPAKSVTVTADGLEVT